MKAIWDKKGKRQTDEKHKEKTHKAEEGSSHAGIDLFLSVLLAFSTIGKTAFHAEIILKPANSSESKSTTGKNTWN